MTSTNAPFLSSLSALWKRRTGAPVASASLVDVITKRVLTLGVFNNPQIPQDATDFVAIAGEQPRLVLDFFDYTTPLNITRLNAFQRAGQVPVISWMPQDGTNATVQAAYQLADIISGTHDAYMTTYLTAIKNLGYPVFVRWAHEMNGNWYPWSEGVNGNTTGQYVTAWRHVHDLATSLGVTNIAWVWAVTSSFTGSLALAGLYPGDDYVDVIAVNGYNWGATGPSGWVTPSTVFDATLAELDDITISKPLWISEVGCAPDDGGSKATWFGQFFDWILTTRVSAFIYFNTFRSEVLGEKDWRVNSSPQSAAGFTSGMTNLRTATRSIGQDARLQLIGPGQLKARLDSVVQAINTRFTRNAAPSYSLWAGGNCETMSRVALSDIPGVSGRMTVVYVTAPSTVTITKLGVTSSSVAAATPTVARIALFTVVSNGNLTKVAQTANDTTIGATQYTESIKNLSTTGGFPASYTLREGQRYAFGWLSVAATPPSLHGANADFSYLDPQICRTISGQTDIAVSYTDASLSSYWQPLFIIGAK
jgi:hypothetical protein